MNSRYRRRDNRKRSLVAWFGGNPALRSRATVRRLTCVHGSGNLADLAAVEVAGATLIVTLPPQPLSVVLGVRPVTSRQPVVTRHGRQQQKEGDTRADQGYQLATQKAIS